MKYNDPRVSSRPSAANLALILFLTVGLAISATAAPPGGPENFPDVRLPAKARGEAAIAALGANLPAIAAFYRQTPAQLRAVLRRDQSLWVDEYGRLFYVCNWSIPPVDEPEPPPGPTPFAVSPAGYPYEQTFLLHSRPGSTKIIYLDFDGHDASTTSWGSDAIGRPFDLDSNPTTFSTTERDQIQYIWQRVSEDFALYDIDVTTQDPGVEALRRSPTTDTAYGIRVVIGGSSSDWYGSAGGVAFVGSFNSSSDTPCWVWPGSLSNSEKNIAEATSHEVGHTLGLNHDGADVGTNHTEYYSGHGNWAPIMGVGYSKPITQWSKGEYTNANNAEDDLTRMLSFGASYRPDDHGNSIGAATPLSGVAFTIPGNIERTTDLDYFSFTTGAGRVVLTVTPFSRGPNLKILLTLYDSVGTVLISTNTADTTSGVLPVTISTVLPIGTYYCSVDGIGTGSPSTTGYSDYASIGQYTLSGALPSDSGWLPIAAGVDYLWTNPANWASNTIPLGADAFARINNNIAGDQTISLEIPVTLGRLYLGDNDNSHSFLLQNGSAGSLIFKTTSGNAQLVKLAGASDIITASVQLQTNLVVTNLSPNGLTLAGIVSGPGNLVKMGTGPLRVSGSVGNTGSTIVSAGSLVVDSTGALTSSKGLDVQAGALLDVTQLGGGYSVANGQTLSGSGTVLGDLTGLAGSQIAPGTNGTVGNLTFSNHLTLNDGAKLNFDLTAQAAGPNDRLTVNGDLNLTGNVQIDFNFLNDVPASPDIYTLITYAGALDGSAANFVAVNYSNRFAFTFDDSVPGEIRVLISGHPTNLVWKGDGVLNRWDIAGAANWLDEAGSAQFFQLDNVLFDDFGSNTPSILLEGTLRPLAVTVDTAQTYSFAGSGRISGTTALTKQGPGMLVLSTPNNYTGATTVAAGTLRMGHATALGSSVGATTVATGAVLDLNGFNLGAEPLVVQGAGLGNGAIINASALVQSNALRFVTLSNHTTFGGTGRWDIRANPTGAVAGNGFNLVKTNLNEIWLANLGLTGLGDIAVNQGQLMFQGSTTMGDSNKTVTIAPGAAVGLWNTDDNVLAKNFVMNDAGFHSYSGDNLFAGTITLNGTNTFTSTNMFTLQGQLSGAGAVRKIGSGILSLTASNNFQGVTLIAGGTLQTRNSWALGSTNGATIISTGARLDVGGTSLGAEPVIVQGTGLGNAGAIVNNGSSQTAALRFVTLSANTSFGGIGRWDIRANPTASLAGNNFVLTKTGINEVWIVDAGGTGLANITVSEGLLGFQGSTTLGNAASTVSVNSAGTLGFFGNGTNVLNKILTLNSGRVFNSSGSNTFIGATTLNNSNRFDAASSTTLVMGGVLSGAGTLNKIGAGTLILANNNTYSGPTIIAGILQFGDGKLTGAPGGGNITNNATLAFHRTNSFTIPNFITGSGALRHGVIDAANPYVGSVLTLSANNAYLGQTIINGHGNLIAVATDFGLGSGTVVFNGNNNGISLSGIRSANANSRTLTNNLQFGGGNNIQFGVAGTGDLNFNGALVITDNSDKTLIVSNSTTTINNAIGNNSRLIKAGPGTLVLGGNNTYGGLTINFGTVRVDNENRLGANPSLFNSSQLTLNGGTLQNTTTFAINDSNRGINIGSSGGTFNVISGTTLTIDSVISGSGGLVKTGAGTLEVTATNMLISTVTVTNTAGALVVNGLLPGSFLNVAAGTLKGDGIVTAPALISPGATLEPGNSIGTLTFTNTLQLSGNCIFELNKSASTNDQVRGMASVIYGGTLTVTNLAGTLGLGDRFKLFDAQSYSGAFAAIEPVRPGPNLAWDTTDLTVDGTLGVLVYEPHFTPPTLSGTTLTFSGSGGPPDGNYYVLTSTNVAAPENQWTRLATNLFDSSGNFSFVTEISTNVPLQFYRIQVP